MRTYHIVTLFMYIAYIIIKHLPVLRICMPVMRLTRTQVYIQQFLSFIKLLSSNDTDKSLRW